MKVKGTLDFARTDIGIDFTCTCGKEGFFSTFDPPVPLLQCCACDTVFKLDEEVELLPLNAEEKADYLESKAVVWSPRSLRYSHHDARNRETDPNGGTCRADMQWKCCVAVLHFTCSCGQAVEASGDFLYNVTCHRCDTVYHVSGRLKMHAMLPAHVALLGSKDVVPARLQEDILDLL